MIASRVCTSAQRPTAWCPSPSGPRCASAVPSSAPSVAGGGAARTRPPASARLCRTCRRPPRLHDARQEPPPLRQHRSPRRTPPNTAPARPRPAARRSCHSPAPAAARWPAPPHPPAAPATRPPPAGSARFGPAAAAATTGRAADHASTTTLPSGSWRDGQASTSAPASSAACVIPPARKMRAPRHALLPRRAPAARLSSGPSPAITPCTPGKCGQGADQHVERLVRGAAGQDRG